MVLVQLAVDEEGQFLGTTKNTPVSMHHTMRDLWKGLIHDGLITQVRCYSARRIFSVSFFPSPQPIRVGFVHMPRARLIFAKLALTAN